MRCWKLVKKNLWLISLIIGLAFLGLGFALGQAEVIWQKAVMICMECIGIG